MDKDKICTSASFLEVWRWFHDKMNSWVKKHADDNDPWIKELNYSNVYCQELDENGKVIGWYRIVGMIDHGPNITLKIMKPNGKIEI